MMKIIQMLVNRFNMGHFINREIDNLRQYVSESNPTVNKWLRNNQDGSGLTFDSLFSVGHIPQPLFRLLPNGDVYTYDNIYSDPGYLSCTSDFDSFIGHVLGSDIACLQFIIPIDSLRIDVHALLPENNDENEYILPRGQRYKVTSTKVFSGKKEIAVFLNKVNSSMAVNEICDLYKIKSIHLYQLSKE